MIDLSCPLCGAEPGKAQLACPCCKRPLDPEWEPDLAMLSVEKVHCQACRATFPSYLMGSEERAIVEGVRKALKDQDEGRNAGCWPLVSFGWKDADLDAEGCTGIKAIIGAKEDRLILAIGGHKTFVASDCLDTDDEEKRAAFDEAMREIVCSTGYPSEWTGDDWCSSWSGFVALPIVMKDGKPDFEATATRIISDSEQACRAFEEAMAHASEAANELYEEMSK
jgi:hypothetical protein